MTDQEDMPETPEVTTARSKMISLQVVILLAVIAVFAGVLTAKVLASRSAIGTDGQARAGSSLTSVHNNAVADYEAAAKTGKPIYVLFHSLS